MIDQRILTQALKTQFAPALRSIGFVGSGRHFRRLNADCIHVVWVQVHKAGGSFAVNLGLQPLDIPDVMGAVPDKKTITEPDCEFRQRLSDNGVDQWWSFSSEGSAIEAAKRCAATFLRIADTKFAEQTGESSLLRTITPAEFDLADISFSGFTSTRVRMARALALMRKTVSDRESVREFAMLALKNMGGARGLEGELEALARE